MHSSIRVRLIIAFISLAIGPLLLVGVILAWQSFASQQEQALNLQAEVAQRVAAQVTAFFEQQENQLRLVSQVQGLRRLNRDQQYNLLARLLSYQDLFEELVLFDSQGREQIYLSRLDLPSTNRSDLAKTDAFVIPQATGQVYYSPVRFDEMSGEPLMIIAIPLLEVRTGQVDGVLIAETRLKKIWDLIASIQISPGQNVYIVDGQGEVVAHRNPSVVLRGTHFNVPNQNGIHPGLTGERAVLAVEMVRFGQQEFYIVAEQATSEALALGINAVRITMSLVVTMLVLSGILGWLMVRQIVQPIETMAVIARTISAGDLSQQVPVTRRDELGILGEAFNDMTRQLWTVINDLERQIAERKQAEESLRAANESLQALFDYSPLAIVVIDLDGHVWLWNKAAEKMYGWSDKEVLGKFLPNISQEKLEEHQAIRERVTKGESITNLEVERQRKDGSTFFLEVSIAPLRDATGKVYAQMSIGADVTERKRAEEALREKTEELDRFFSVALDLLCIADTEGHFRRLNPQWEIVLGYSLSELEGQRFLDLVHPDDQASTLAALAELNSHKIVLDFVNRYRCQDGSYRWIEWRAFPVGNLVYAAARDITERRQVEETLRLTQLAVDRARDAIHWVGPNGQMLYVNEATCQSLGYTREELLSMTVFDIDPNFSKETWPVHWHRDSDRGHYMLETIHKAKDGRLFPVEILVDRVNYAGKEFNCVYARDITERKRVEAALRESEDLLRRSQSVAHIGSYYFDVRTGKWISSPALDEIFGIDDSFPKNVDGWIALVHLEDKDEMLRHLTQHVLAEHNRFNKEYRLIRYDNQQERWMHGLGELEFDQSGNPVKMIGTIQDITERKLVEEALRTSQANLSLVFNNASDMQALFEIEKNQKLRIIAINHSYLTSLHSLGLPLFTPDFFIGQYQDEVLLKLGFPKEGIEAEANHFLHAIESLSDVRWETVVPSPVKAMFVESTVVPVMNNDGLCTHLLYSSRDVTERKQAEEKIQASLHEKEVLLKEIHHRVKNNMQIMSSLLDLQAGNIKDAQVRELFKESQQRIKSMALIHERLYQSQDLAHINFAEYLQSLVNYIRQSYGARAAAITIQVKADPILLGVETAIPCGLIINELVSNALKHAFPDGRAGQIYLTLETNAENHLVLSVRDNGIGFPAEIDFRRTQSLGLTLVMTLIKQINGTIELKNQAGTEFRIIFLARGK